ncbi:UDP-N-acetyl-D-mannosamine dehydrogenase [Brevundimonas lutea]|uniref:UDP-N-acetyl-D-mannosamine dehydrogenase n=1 Tax=Brevundimonas lutea TaxID=2293980 RepID=UPI0023E78A8A|nr:UDP-N-acetyl-D-mannosamine dehydrogenase [Brevundimonas lutea]
MPLTLYAEFQPRPAERQTLCIVGLGYIGLPTGAALADADYNVIGVDIDPAIVESVNAGKVHIIEPGLEPLVARVVRDGAFRAQTTIPEADVYLITVPTPVVAESNRPDLSHVFAAARAVAEAVRPGALVVLESTSPVGATRRMIDIMASARPELRFPQPGADDEAVDVDIAYSPERVIPGKTLNELASNARIVGGATPRAARRAAAVYRALTQGELLLTDDRSAEFVKLTENAFRDVNIAFANELSLICDRMGLNVWDVIQLANRHPRVEILKPGAGVGGHCIAVDPWFIVDQAPEEAKLIRAAREVNDHKPAWLTDKVSAMLELDPEARLGCLGLTFKADVDDFRESPALEIALRLSRRFPGRVVCAEPFAEALKAPPEIQVVSLEEALVQPIVAALVPHSAFRQVDRPAGVLVDACGLWQ